VDDMILACDVNVGDVVVLPDAQDPVLVNRVCFGQGGLVFTVTSAGTPEGRAPAEQECPVKLTAAIRLCERGRDTIR
jgi:hypothetical protein